MLANDVAAGGTRLGRTVSAVALAVAAVAGGVVLAFTMGGLREADLYRQRTGEGLLFAIVGTGLVVATRCSARRRWWRFGARHGSAA